MKYFAKYLPVEGEIKEGDWFTWQDEGTDTPWLFKCIGLITDTHLQVKWSQEYGAYPNGILRGEINEDGYGDWNKDFATKVKFFLCSRDIQVGDTCIDGEGDKVEILDHTGSKENAFKVRIGDAFALGCFKVIGEISSKATWVKEWDEFDDKSVIALEWGGSSIRKPIHLIRPEFIGTSKIYVKGPCGHFH